MRLDQVIKLLKIEDGINDNGFPEKIVVDQKEILAAKRSVKSNEFYSAAQSGYELEIMFEVHTLEYGSQKHLEYEGKTYEIVRTYEKGRYIELICKTYDEKP
ncbi:phage head closure protein [Chengkuizengella sp. SCS-71B]|uniref:phage head closure protein n=1 Tax=Chengkuizengella sp. SCS-71B TaxID=3115290 RepID=UPI0032C23AB8